MAQRVRVVFENDHVRLSRRGSGGRWDPPKIIVNLLQNVGRDPHFWSFRRIDMTRDELFELTDALDDLCDAISDEEQMHIENGRN